MVGGPGGIFGSLLPTSVNAQEGGDDAESDIDTHVHGAVKSILWWKGDNAEGNNKPRNGGIERKATLGLSIGRTRGTSE
jgi:hypothetical protein